MSLGHVLKYALGAYVADVIVRPHLAAQKAKVVRGQSGKPVLNIGAGTAGSSLRVALLGPTLWGDVNIDIAADKRVPDGPRAVSWGDACDLSKWPDKHFSAVIASHVLEHVNDPHQAVREWHRVADHVYILVPRWWAPHTWTHPGHQWFITGDGDNLGSITPLWSK